jgi:hypothetical protein
MFETNKKETPMNKNPIIAMLLLIVSMLSLAACNLTDEPTTTEPTVVTDTTAVDTIPVDTTDSIPNAVCVLDSTSITEMFPSDYLNDTALALITVWDSDSVIVKDTTIRANLYPTFNWLQVTLNTPCSNVMSATDSLEHTSAYTGQYTNRAGETFDIQVSLFLKKNCMVYDQCESLFELYYPKDPE